METDMNQGVSQAMKQAMNQAMRWLLFGLMTCSAGVAATPELRVESVAQGLDHPWSLAFLPDGRMLVTERPGRLRIIDASGALLEAPVAGVPAVYDDSQGGLFDILLAPDFSTSGVVYLSFAHGDAAANHTRVVRARLTGTALDDVTPIFTSMPAKATPVHYGGRMAWLADGTLVIGIGDGFDLRESAQDLATHTGSIVRLHPDGRVPADNPYVEVPGARPELFSIGHRNPQGLVYDAANDLLLSHEHGPKGGDELNHVTAGSNYGWPVITHGVDYTGARVTPFRQMPGMQQPLIDWTPSIGPSGMAIYDGDRFVDWQGDLFVSTLVERGIRHIARDGVVLGAQQILLAERLGRVRDVQSGPDGALYVLTDAADGEVLRITPAP